mmetsp:Transcript_8880/g.19078  ORF Transcript_8880/g.19078 Transcript_8880/m.19078 type:complete len:346 (-) Transcript_8880:7-1044(-)
MVAINNLDAYVGWTVAQGIQSPLQLRSTQDGQYRYATASQPIAPNDTILRVPLASCLTAENLEALAERLKYERDAGARSKFEPYIKMLPSFEQLKVLPRFWDDNLVATVTDGGQLESRIIRDKNDILDPWALACVDSRANFMQDCYSLTPFLDMINHDASLQTKARVEKNRGFASTEGDVLCLQSSTYYKEGEECFISYGDLSNLDALCDYGFLTEDNPCNKESIQVRLIGSEPFSINVLADGSVDAGSKSILRYKLATESELEAFSSFDEGNGLGLLSKPLSERNELDVQSFIASTIDEARYDAHEGASAVTDNSLISLYLGERSKLLQLAIDRIKMQFPDLEY